MSDVRTTVFGEAECERCRKDFPSLLRTFAGHPVAFLDGPGGTQVPEAVIEAIADCYRHRNVNSHGNFPVSEELDQRITAARSAVAEFLGASPERISFGQNMTTLAFALSRALSRSLRPGDEVMITALDHEANRGPWQQLQAMGAVIREVPLLQSGMLDYEAMAGMVNAKTRVMAIGCSSNALGTVNDLAEARRLSRQAGAWLILDAVHYAPHFAIDVAALDPDFLLCSAYKFYGPHVGILYSKPGRLEALTTDKLAVQENQAPYRIETGTLNYPAIEGVTAAIDYLASFGQGPTRRHRLLDAFAAIGAYEHQLAEFLWEALAAVPGVRCWGVPFPTAALRAPTVSFTIEGVDPGAAARALGSQGICLWDGDFYAPRPVSVLNIPGRSLIRVGFSMYNTRQEAQRLVEAVKVLASRSSQLS